MASSPLSDYLKKVQPTFVSAIDVIACCAHAIFINAGCKLVALGDVEEEIEVPKNSLPGRWNQNKTVYTFIYRHKGRRILLKVLPIDDQVMISAVAENNPQTPAIPLKYKEYVNTDSLTNFGSCLKKENTLISIITNQICEPLDITPEKKQANSTRDERIPYSDPLIINPGRHDPLRPGRRQQPQRPRFPGDFGGDLDPFGSNPLGSNPGNLMGPNHGIFQPRGNPRRGYDPQRPPGSRYDPVGPNGIPLNPNPDHFQMPGRGTRPGSRGRGPPGGPGRGPPGNMFF